MNHLSQGVRATALALFALACSDSIASELTGPALTDPEADASRVVSVAVTLAQSSLEVGMTTQATATLLDRANRPVYRTVTWSSSDSAIATVSSTGLVTARSVGSAAIIASRGDKTARAVLTVTASGQTSVPVAAVAVTLTDSSLTVGQTSQATATTRDANNNVLTGRTVTWVSSNIAVATVSAGGLVTAVAAGSAQITATSEGRSGSAPVGVAAGTTTPPPSGSVEPSGMTPLTERPYSTMLENGWAVYAWSGTTANCEIVSDASAPKSPASAARIRYPAGFPGGGEPCGWAKGGMPNYRTWYLSFWFKISPNWQGHPTTVNKMLHINIGGSNRVVVNLWGSGSGTMQAGILLQGILAGGNFDGGTSANFYPNLGPTGAVVRDRWYHEEVVLVGNTSGSANGSVEWWLDGVKIGSRTGIQFTSGNGYFGEQIAWAPTWGGGGSTVSSTMYEYMDHLYLSGK